MGLTVRLSRPGTVPEPLKPPVTESDVVLQALLPEKYRAPAQKLPPAPVSAEDPIALVINYPRSGKRVLPAGITVISIKQRKVRLPDGTDEEMYASRAVDSCRCFGLYTDRMIDVRISWGGSLVLTTSIFPAWFRKLDMLEFDVVEVECTEPTTFYITMSEVPDGVPEHHPERWLSPKVELGYNAAGDMVSIRKVINGITYTRTITDPDVADAVVDKWIEYGTWTPS
jgi:hypothetical protein